MTGTEMVLRRKLFNDVLFMVLLAAATLGAYAALQWTRGGGDTNGAGPAVSGQVAPLQNLDVMNADQLDQSIATLQARLEQNGADSESLARLGLAYLQKARETADPTYYGKAEKALANSFDLDQHNYESLTGLGALALSRHDFTGALRWATLAVAENPYAPAVYGVLTDALIERAFAALDPTGTALRCTHPLFAEVLRSQLPPGRRRRLCAWLLDSLPTDQRRHRLSMGRSAHHSVLHSRGYLLLQFSRRHQQRHQNGSRAVHGVTTELGHARRHDQRRSHSRHRLR